MRLILLEGMSTSGKTTVLRKLSELLEKRKIKHKAFDELQTMSRDIFSHVNSRKSIDEMKTFLQKECLPKDGLVICDRFHLSHMSITDGSISEFDEIEADLKKYDPVLIFLEISSDAIRDRLIKAKNHRGKQWEDELIKRGQTEDEAIKWFMGTQNNLLKLYNQSNLPKEIFNTTNHNYDAVANEIYTNYVV